MVLSLIMPAQLLGAHMPIAGGLGKAVRRGKEIGCTAVQVFTNNPRQWTSKPLEQEKIDDLAAAVAETGINSLISHDTYLINLCAPNEETKAKSIAAIKSELVRCAALGIPYAISHMGAHMKQGEEEGLRQIAEETVKVLEDTPDGATLLMETTAGQGTSMNWRFEHLASIYDQTGNPDRLGVCLDTCHIFAAGYDIRDEETYERTFSEFDRLVGIDKIKVIHCNDSKKDLGTRVDRHDNIGEGLIGIEAFRLLVNDPRFEQVPIILETPDADKMHEVNLKRLMDLRE
jgi:deoxyribonuclease-4